MAALLELIGRCTSSLLFVLLTQSSLSLVPAFFSSSPLLLQLSLSAVVLVAVIGLGSRCRRLAGVTASAPAFVFFNIIFIWCVYLGVVRTAASRIMDIVFNVEVATVLLGLSSIISSNPGIVAHMSLPSEEPVQSSVHDGESHEEGSLLRRRARYCKSCKAYIRGFDHHCPAFGNCIGEKNRVLFMVLLVGFLITETSYVVCSNQFAQRFRILGQTNLETNLAHILANSTMLFSLFQVPWQVIFFAWHICCICFNVTTDEWINWKNYPEFQQDFPSQPGESSNRIRFRNPYDKGVVQNVMGFLTYKG